ncbi:MAG: hypothetical protein EU521_01890 [Promethearchaeota archaeon]|nr:MAG: hypothetical protein EU521_01890 [Candidatus Lokiarchaeota archaeon]
MKNIKKMNRLKHKLSRLKLFLSDFKPILLSHHPNCEKFSDHVYHIGKYKFCIGCFTFYPTIAVTILFSILFIDLTITNLVFIMVISNVFFLPLILNFLGLTKYKALKVFSKISIGIGVGLWLVAVLFLPFHIILKILFLLQVNFFVGVIAYIRANHIKKDCLKCEYHSDWENCPGMSEVVQKLYLHGFKKRKEKCHDNMEKKVQK